VEILRIPISFVLPGMSEVEVRRFQVHGLEELRLKFLFEDAGTDAPAAPHLSHNRARFKLSPIPHPADFQQRISRRCCTGRKVLLIAHLSAQFSFIGKTV